MDPRGLQKQHFPGFLEFVISMPLSTRIAVFACPCASSSFQDAAKKHLGTDSRQKRSRHCSFATFSRKCPKMGSRQGSRGGSANHLFATFFALVSYGVSRGALGRPNAPQGFQNDAPGLPKRSRMCHRPHHFLTWALPQGYEIRIEGTVAGTPQANR